MNLDVFVRIVGNCLLLVVGVVRWMKFSFVLSVGRYSLLFVLVGILMMMKLFILVFLVICMNFFGLWI